MASANRKVRLFIALIMVLLTIVGASSCTQSQQDQQRTNGATDIMNNDEAKQTANNSIDDNTKLEQKEEKSVPTGSLIFRGADLSGMNVFDFASKEFRQETKDESFFSSRDPFERSNFHKSTDQQWEILRYGYYSVGRAGSRQATDVFPGGGGPLCIENPVFVSDRDIICTTFQNDEMRRMFVKYTVNSEGRLLKPQILRNAPSCSAQEDFEKLVLSGNRRRILSGVRKSGEIAIDLQVYDVPSDRIIAHFSLSVNETLIAISPDGKFVAYIDEDKNSELANAPLLILVKDLDDPDSAAESFGAIDSNKVSSEILWYQ